MATNHVGWCSATERTSCWPQNQNCELKDAKQLGRETESMFLCKTVDWCNFKDAFSGWVCFLPSSLMILLPRGCECF